ncbi:MAG: hypothetical protein AAGC60_21615 [Acidobacteriota bacterium]
MEDYVAPVFSRDRVREFLEILAQPQRIAAERFPLGSMELRCFATGFYFFAHSIKNELRPDLANELVDLAIRFQNSALESNKWSDPDVYWNRHSETAAGILDRYFSATI